MFFPRSMLESVANLKKKEKKGPIPGSGAFQQLFLLVGFYLFKVRNTSRPMPIAVLLLLQPY